MFLPPDFDRAIAVEAAALVLQAYDQYEKFTHGASFSLSGNYDTLGLMSAKGPGILARVEPFGFVARSRTSGNVFAVFRGTQSLEDWMANLSFPQVEHPWGHAEKGFKDLYDQCAAATRAAVQQAPAGANVYVTGHSLGSALATLATADLVDSGSANVNMYNFASPRVGDRSFADRFNGRVANRWRIVNTEDIVTTVPIATPELGTAAQPHNPMGMFLMLAHHLDFEHVGNPVSFTAHNGSIVANHLMSTYIAAL
jgi:triacylglycerol lipase